MSIIGVLTLIFIVLKLFGMIAWTWIWVFSPIWIWLIVITVLIFLRAMLD